MGDQDTCPICLERGVDLRWPGCGHRFHALCALQMAQYDLRCAVCRSVPKGAVVRPSDPPPAEPRPAAVEIQRRWRNYVDRRRRFINKRPDIQAQERHLRDLRVESTALMETLQRTYDAKCREVWTTDQDVRDLRRRIFNLRRRERRLSRLIEREMDGHVPGLQIVIDLR